jgi:hypothetical protein
MNEFSDFQISVSEAFVLVFSVEFPLSWSEPRVCGCSYLREFVGFPRGPGSFML